MSDRPKRTPRIQPNDIILGKTTKKNTPTSKRGRLNNAKTMTHTDAALTIDVIRSLLAEKTDSLKNSIRNKIKALGDEIKSEFQAKII